MRRLFHRLRDGERGAAATEMALLTLVLIPTALYSIFLFEMSWAKIKGREAARYLVWEMSAVGLSDWQEGDHPKRFEAVQGILTQEVNDRYGDDLQSATPAYLTNAPKMMSIEVSFKADATTLKNLDAELWNVGNEQFNTQELGKGIDWLFDRFGFTRAGKVEGSITVHIKNTLLGKTMPVFYTDKMLMQDEFDMPITQSLIVEQWDLKKGDAVIELHQTNCATSSGSDFCKQVQRMSFVGLTDYTGGFLTSDGQSQGIVNQVLGLVDFHNPLEAVVVSTPLKGDNDMSNISPDLYVPDDHNGIVHKNMHKQYFTSPYKDTKGNNDSPYTQAYNKRGVYFLGCKEPEQKEGECDYKN